MAEVVYLSLGSNLGDRRSHLRRAIERLRGLGEVVAVSSFYETEPVEMTEQPWFLNCALALRTELSPQALLAAVMAIEHSLGRQRELPKGPRTADVDILLYGERVVESPELTIPHPSLHLRRFVLEPLAEIAGELRHPLLRRSVRELRDTLPPGGAVRKLES